MEAMPTVDNTPNTRIKAFGRLELVGDYPYYTMGRDLIFDRLYYIVEC